MHIFPLSVFLAVASLAGSQFVKPPKDLKKTTGYANVSVRYKQVPAGTCEQNPNVKSYSGYADIAPNQHIFFWFFEARKAPKKAPITAWINGGPGSSSMIGLFQELGPCGVDSAGKVYNNPYAWNEVSNMLFIDQPTTTGFSYSIPVPAYENRNGDIVQLPNNTCPAAHSDTCGTWDIPDTNYTANSTTGAAEPFYLALQGILGSAPIKPYTSNGFHFATESYGGHYGPVFSAYIHKQNLAIGSKSSTIPAAHHIDLRTLLIGNGWFIPLIQYPSYYNFTVSPGNTYLKPFYPNVSTEREMYDATYGQGNCTDQLEKCISTGSDDDCSNADNFCYEYVEYLYDEVTGRDEYDLRELDPDPFPYNFYPDYLNLASTQAAIGAFTNFSDSSPIVGDAFGSTGDDARDPSSTDNLATLVQAGINVVLYDGDADYICNWVGVEAVADLVEAPGFSRAGYANIQTSDGKTHGQVKQANNFSFVRIYQAGHEVPFYQPVAALEMFERSIAGKDIETGKQTLGKGYTSKGTKKSKYFEGSKTVQNDVLPDNATYNIITDAPDPPSQTRLGMARRGLKDDTRRRSTVARRWGRRRFQQADNGRR
ncbi:MAG: hypothetical protein Q9227_005735 [Pyrenula ochraceoflavens]